MPNFNGAGPLGYGAMTGRGMGFCACPTKPWRSRGFRRWQPTKTEEKETLEEDLKYLKEEMEAINERLNEINGQK